MDNKIVSLSQPRVTQTRILLAEVVEAEDGEALNIYLPELNKEVNVFAHSASVPSICVGDNVLVEQVESHYVVTHRLRIKGESPQKGFSQKSNGQLEINSDSGIVIQSNGSKIEIQQDGRIKVDGKEIYSIATGKQRLQGATIELN